MKRQVPNRIKNKKDFLIIIFIVMLPFLFYFYKLVPENIWIWPLGLLRNDNGYFEFDYYIWLLFVKIFTLVIISIWFITCKQKWKNVLLFTVFIEIQKIVANINFARTGEYLNEYIWITLLIFIPYYFILIQFSKNMNYNITNNSMNNKINEEINEQLDKLSVFNANDYKVINKELIQLEKSKESMDQKKYLIKLLALRDRLTV